MVTLKTLNILINEKLVGVLTKLADGRIIFTFDEKYIADRNRVVLSQCYYSTERILLTQTRAYRSRLPPFFANLLPEGSLRNYVANSAGIKPTNEFEMLRLLGEDLPGAIVARPSEYLSLSGHDLSNETTEEQENTISPYHFSLAGIQLKFSALMNGQAGLTIPAGGIGGDWIVKLPSPTYDNVPENEYAIMHMAKAIGIPVPDIKLIKLKDVYGLPNFNTLRGDNAFAIKRFDRQGSSKRIHIEDFAQVYSIMPDKKYEGVSYDNIANMVWILAGKEGLVDFIRRLTYTILTGNGDMHLKNWSFVYADGRTPQLSPAYDLLSTIPYIPRGKLALKLAKNRGMASLSIISFTQLAENASIPKNLVLETVRDTVSNTLKIWQENRTHYNLPQNIARDVNNYMQNTALAVM